jgi:hypothetical protein
MACEISDCDRPGSGRYCAMHTARARRGTPMHQRVQERLSARERMRQAAIAFADADADDDHAFAEADDVLRKAVERYMRERFGKRGGRARAAKLSSEQRVQIAKKAIASRWSRNCSPSEKYLPASIEDLNAEKRAGEVFEGHQTARAGVGEGQERQPRRPAGDGEGAALQGARVLDKSARAARGDRRGSRGEGQRRDHGGGGDLGPRRASAGARDQGGGES